MKSARTDNDVVAFILLGGNPLFAGRWLCRVGFKHREFESQRLE